MNNFIKTVIGILIGLSILPIIISMKSTLEYEDTNFNFTAVSNTTTAEIFDLDDESLIPIDIIFVSVNGIEIPSSEYNYSDVQDLVQLDATSSDIGDLIVITNRVELDTDNVVYNLVSLLPTLTIIFILSGVVILVMKKSKA